MLLYFWSNKSIPGEPKRLLSLKSSPTLNFWALLCSVVSLKAVQIWIKIERDLMSLCGSPPPPSLAGCFHWVSGFWCGDTSRIQSAVRVVALWCENEARQHITSLTGERLIMRFKQVDRLIKSSHLYVNQKGDQSIILIWIKTLVDWPPNSSHGSGSLQQQILRHWSVLVFRPVWTAALGQNARWNMQNGNPYLDEGSATVA